MSTLLLHAYFQDYSEHRLAFSVFIISESFLCAGDTDKETICQVFWFLCNSSFVVALNFVVNLRLSGQFPNIEAIYHLLKLDVHQRLAREAVIDTENTITLCIINLY